MMLCQPTTTPEISAIEEYEHQTKRRIDVRILCHVWEYTLCSIAIHKDSGSKLNVWRYVGRKSSTLMNVWLSVYLTGLRSGLRPPEETSCTNLLLRIPPCFLLFCMATLILCIIFPNRFVCFMPFSLLVFFLGRSLYLCRFMSITI